MSAASSLDFDSMFPRASYCPTYMPESSRDDNHGRRDREKEIVRGRVRGPVRVRGYLDWHADATQLYDEILGGQLFLEQSHACRCGSHVS